MRLYNYDIVRIVGREVCLKYSARFKLNKGKKSIAINVRLEPHKATLTDEQIGEVSQKIINNVENTTGGILRQT